MKGKKSPTLGDLNAKMAEAQKNLDEARKAKKTEEFPALKEALRMVKEEVRVFAYRAKPYLTANGHLLRP